jgi:hypothetical protein
VKKQIGSLVVLIVLISAAVDSATAALTEPQPPMHAASQLSAVPTQPGKPAWLTPEKEAALVEVRKILREARVAAEGIQTPSPVLSDRHRRKALERMKAELLHTIEEAQLQAGDVTITSTHKQSLALTQARYGFTNEAVQTVSTEAVTGESLVLLVESLVHAVAQGWGETLAAKDSRDCFFLHCRGTTQSRGRERP